MYVRFREGFQHVLIVQELAYSRRLCPSQKLLFAWYLHWACPCACSDVRTQVQMLLYHIPIHSAELRGADQKESQLRLRMR